MAQDTLHSAADIRKYFVIMTYVKGGYMIYAEVSTL